MAQRTPQVLRLLQYVCVGLALIASVELFKYSFRVNYDWVHCTPVKEQLSQGTSAYKIFSVGGPSCDKRGEFKSIMKKMASDYQPQVDGVSFCIKESKDVPPIHYPTGTPKGKPGYVAYVAYESDSPLISEVCQDATIMHF
ncbi:LANO_0C08944g1_1 [Lachancea nothofagi CBS 11611]|uniref:LANO_0C08944g1_1 n=1 Tax=Lachancea nothofagi CBS 11611 TaxID=1266666 RepID=A0A1G4J9M4_9SACH|nr:LANO_0C08944g1_1 [Lachancea nothofagi CBS 11611]